MAGQESRRVNHYTTCRCLLHFLSGESIFHLFALLCILYCSSLGCLLPFLSGECIFMCLLYSVCYIAWLWVCLLHFLLGESIFMCSLYTVWYIAGLSCAFPGQNIISQACYIVEIRRSGSEPSISFQEKSIFMCFYSVCYYCSIVDCFLHYGNFPSRRGHFHVFTLQCMLYCFDTGLSSAFPFRRKHFHVFVLQCMLYCFDAGLSLAYPFRSKHFHLFALQCMLYCSTLGCLLPFLSGESIFMCLLYSVCYIAWLWVCLLHFLPGESIFMCLFYSVCYVASTLGCLWHILLGESIFICLLYSVCCVAQCSAVFCINFPSKRGHFHVFTLHCTLDFVTLLCCESLKRLMWMFSPAVPVASAMGRCRARWGRVARATLGWRNWEDSCFLASGLGVRCGGHGIF